MINRLINMEVKPLNMRDINNNISNKNYTIEEYVNAFINGMGETQRNRFKKMLENGIECGMSVAENYNLDYNKFIIEVKKQMGVN